MGRCWDVMKQATQCCPWKALHACGSHQAPDVRAGGNARVVCLQRTVLGWEGGLTHVMRPLQPFVRVVTGAGGHVGEDARKYWL